MSRLLILGACVSHIYIFSLDLSSELQIQYLTALIFPCANLIGILLFVCLFEVGSIPSVESNMGLKLMALTSRPELSSRVGRLTERAAQVLL